MQERPPKPPASQFGSQPYRLESAMRAGNHEGNNVLRRLQP